MKTILLLVLAITTGQAMAATWGVEEILESSQASALNIKAKFGQAAYDSVTGIAVTLNAQKVAANTKVTYVEMGQAKTVSYFCHQHSPTEIDCH
jgi:hypothetical protein